MTSAGASPETWAHFLTADPQLIGVVSWLGLIVTTAGFGIALYQIRKVQKSADAANQAVVNLVTVVRSQEQSAKISDAVGHLRSAQTMLKQHNLEATVAHLDIGWSALIAARELTNAGEDYVQIEEFVISTRRLSDDLSAPGITLPPTTKVGAARHAELSKTLNGLGMMSARLTTILSGLGLQR